MGRPSQGKWIQEKTLVFPPDEDCYIYKRPNSSIYQYFLSIPGEGEERKSTKQKTKEDALRVARDRKLEVMMRQKQGLKAKRVKNLFDFIDDYLVEESKRVTTSNKPGKITAETFRVKSHHLKLLKKFYHNRSIRCEDIDYPKLHQYPTWRGTVDVLWNPTPPKTQHTIKSELTTIKAYFAYLFRLGYIPREPDFAKVKSESLRNNRRDYLNPRQYQQTINTIRSWSKSKNLTPSQEYNRQVVYQAILIMSNALCRIGELKKLRWMDLEPNTNLSKEDQKIGHLIRVRAEATKVGEARTISSPTTKHFQIIRELSGIPKHKGPFPNIPPDRRSDFVFSKFNKPDQPLGQGTWDRCWSSIKELCSERYWNQKNITWYSFRHTGISFAVSRGVPMLQLSRNAGTGTRYLSDVYYHHESESQQTWDTLMQNRVFYNNIKRHERDVLVEIEDVMGDIDVDSMD